MRAVFCWIERVQHCQLR